ncbi:MAG: hypothetical protein SAL07_08025 [Oscillatoria sp. PMC 1051.18]|nr:hypothetical protein [Oscillatoria sp. PMC 1050.18]MEC5029844.1 hypothetical protein [Oscillatoria sp. PMC 1051.18]
MKKLLQLLTISCLLSFAPTARAVEWVEVVVNEVGDKFFVDRDTLDPKGNGDIVWFWEHREFLQPNNAFLEEDIGQPLYAVTVYRSVDCTNYSERQRQIIAYDREKRVIRRFNYGDTGRLYRPMNGSSSAQVLEYVCKQVSQ